MTDAGGADAKRSSHQALLTADAAGIRRLQIPTPFAVGRVNCYLIEDEPLTLVDTGPNSGKALDQLERQLVRAGHSIEDLELIVITHQHIDHLGLVEIVAEHSGAEVAARGGAAERRDVGAGVLDEDLDQPQVVDVLVGDDHQLQVVDRAAVLGELVLELVEGLA